MTVLTLVAATWLAAANAAAPQAAEPGLVEAASVTDERVYYLGGQDLLFTTAVEDRVLADNEVRGQFHRAGVVTACLAYNRALSVARSGYAAEFRPLLVSAIRDRVPADVLADRRNYGWDSAPMMSHRNRVVARVTELSRPLVDRASAAMRAEFLRSVSAAPTVDPEQGDAGFADWNLDRPLARKVACMLFRSGSPDDFAARKSVFDGLMREGAQR